MGGLTLDILTGKLTVVRISPGDGLHTWRDWSGQPLVSATRTGDEISVSCPPDTVPENITAERVWRLIKVRGVLGSPLAGFLADLATALAEASSQRIRGSCATK